MMQRNLYYDFVYWVTCTANDRFVLVLVLVRYSLRAEKSLRSVVFMIYKMLALHEV